MNHPCLQPQNIVKTLTLLMLPLLTACAVTKNLSQEVCKSRAYIAMDVDEYVNTRFASKSPVRLAITPFSAPANLTGFSNEFPAIGRELARNIQSNMATQSFAPIVEIFNREDWPGKKEEFFTGNFGAIDLGRQAGYDLIMVGYIDNLRSLNSVTAYYKILDPEGGITVWYGQTTATSVRENSEYSGDKLAILDHDIEFKYWGPLIEKLSTCIVTRIRAGQTALENPAPTQSKLGGLLKYHQGTSRKK